MIPWQCPDRHLLRYRYVTTKQLYKYRQHKNRKSLWSHSSNPNALLWQPNWLKGYCLTTALLQLPAQIRDLQQQKGTCSCSGHTYTARLQPTLTLWHTSHIHHHCRARYRRSATITIRQHSCPWVQTQTWAQSSQQTTNDCISASKQFWCKGKKSLDLAFLQWSAHHALEQKRRINVSNHSERQHKSFSFCLFTIYHLRKNRLESLSVRCCMPCDRL